jgi:hypothetical protein
MLTNYCLILATRHGVLVVLRALATFGAFGSAPDVSGPALTRIRAPVHDTRAAEKPRRSDTMKAIELDWKLID